MSWATLQKPSENRILTFVGKVTIAIIIGAVVLIIAIAMATSH